MDDPVLQSASVTIGAPTDSTMELDYMDELLLEGCWLETADASPPPPPTLYHHQNPPPAFFDSSSSYVWPSTLFETIPEKTSITPFHKTTQEEDPEVVAVTTTNNNNPPPPPPTEEKLFGDVREVNKLWIGPRLTEATSSVMDRLIKAVSYIQESGRLRDHILIQIWLPVNKGGTRVLTTINHPFSVNSSSLQLATYRNISMNYVFAAEENSCVSVGLPGRVFLGRVPEWTPDVRFFKVEEYPRVPYAQQCDVRGTLALPVFEQGSKHCIGVIEVVMTTQKVNYRPELENVCRALEAVNLHSSEFSAPQRALEHGCSFEGVLPEILEVLKCACRSHGLPLAQTWVPCIIQQGKQGCCHSDDNLPQCVSTIDSACFVADPCMQGFHEACSDHHLFKNQGVVGQAFVTNEPCFSHDITSFSKLEYPLSHYARMFGLCSAVAIRLRSIYTGNTDFVLEFFLPISCRDVEEQKKALTSLSIIIQRVCRSLRVVSPEELMEETSSSYDHNKVINMSEESMLLNVDDDNNNNTFSQSKTHENGIIMIQEMNNSVLPAVMEEEEEEDKGRRRIMLGGNKFPLESSCAEDDSNMKGSPGRSSSSNNNNNALVGKSGDKKRAKAEKTITLEVLRQHFAGSLKDAAKSIGVCPTTLKRICRQHGIKRWPSRKIKKVGHSLQKLQVVIDSVQGASGAFPIGSFYSNFPDLASPNFSQTTPFSTTKQCDLPQQPNHELEGPPISPLTATSKSPLSSSSSQTSSSSQCCSSGTQQHPFKTKPLGNNEDPLGCINSHECVMKRARSEAQLHGSSSEEATNINKLISRSYSQKSLVEHLNNNNNNNNNGDINNNRPPLPKNGGNFIQEGDLWRVKVTYGEEKIRLRIPKNWGFNELVQEVVRRFNIGDMSGFHLKYLDDDSEWVLLTCDADLEECVDIHQSSQGQTIKLSLQVSHTHSRSSVGSNSHHL